MNRSKKKGYNRTLYRTGRWFRRQKWGKIFLILLLIAAVIGFGYVCIAPSLWQFRSSSLFYILFWMALTVFVVMHVWRNRRSSPLTERIVASLPIIWVWLRTLIPSGQMQILLWTVLFYGSIGYLLYLISLYQTKYESKLMEFIGIELVLWGSFYVISAIRYCPVTDSIPLVFWLPPLVVALICATVIVFLLVTRRLILQKDSLYERIALVIFVPAIIFVLMMCTMGHLNYAFDFNSAEGYTAYVVEKDFYFDVETGGSFELTLDLNGERIELSVSESDYRSREIGDDFAVKLHQGAFGVPFYIAGK